MARTVLIVLTILAILGPVTAEESPLPAPRLVGPRTGPEREAALKKNGGTATTEKAVRLGLDWLARHQAENGGWDADGFPSRCDGKACEGIGKGQHGEEMPCPFDRAISALATLAFLGQGEGPDREPLALPVVVRRDRELPRRRRDLALLVRQGEERPHAESGEVRLREGLVGSEGDLRATDRGPGVRDRAGGADAGAAVPASTAGLIPDSNPFPGQATASIPVTILCSGDSTCRSCPSSRP